MELRVSPEGAVTIDGLYRLPLRSMPENGSKISGGHLRVELPEFAGSHNRDGPELPKRAQIVVARDNHGTVAGNGGPEDHDIVLVAARTGVEGRRLNDTTLGPKQVNGGAGVDRSLTELLRQHPLKLGQQRLRRDQFVLAGTVFQEIGTRAPGHERGDQHVRIQDDLHDVRSKTS